VTLFCVQHRTVLSAGRLQLRQHGIHAALGKSDKCVKSLISPQASKNFNTSNNQYRTLLSLGGLNYAMDWMCH